MNKHLIFRFLNILILITLLVTLLSCERKETKKGSVYAFSTFIDISITSRNAKDDYKNIEDIIKYYHKLCDNYEEYDGINNIKTINDKKENVEISSDLLDILNFVLKAKEDTNGYFNPFIGSLSQIYKDLIDSKDVKDIPSNELIQEELAKMNATTLTISDNKATLNGSGLLDLGAIGKGYALWKVQEYLVSHNITTYLINGGASSIIFGEKENGKNYRVGVKGVDDLVIEKKHKAFGTSSILEQNKVIDGVLYHHIVNPFTGQMDYYYDTVVIVGSNPLMTDLYSTVCFMMSLDEIKNLEIADIEEIYLCKDEKVIYQITGGTNNEKVS